MLKDGYPPSNTFALEELMYHSKVDLAFWGHMHYYERSYPLYKNKKFNVSCKHTYINPSAPVHIITGAAVRIQKTGFIIFGNNLLKVAEAD